MSSAIKNFLIILILLAAVAGGGYYYFITRNQETTDDAMIEASIAPMSAKISGYVGEVDFEDFQPVKKGDVLLKIDPTDYQIKLDHDRAALDSAQSKLAAAQEMYESTAVSTNADVATAEAGLASARANWQKAKADLERVQSLNPEAFARQELDKIIADEKAMHASLNEAQAKLRSAQTAPHKIDANQKMIESMTADVERAKTDVAQSEENLRQTQIVAPFDGVVTKRSIEPGVYVQPGQQLLSVVSTDRWVTANFKESQIGDMKTGQRADLHVDAYPDHDFHGKIEAIQSGTGARFSLFPPENATGNFVKIVQRVPVKISFTDPPDPKYILGPGMSVVVTVHVQ